jgi:hypothetical protein
VCDEPHLIAFDQKRQPQWNNNPENRAAPECHEWSGIGIENAVRQVPRKQFSRLEFPAATPATNKMPHLVRECHDDP